MDNSAHKGFFCRQERKTFVQIKTQDSAKNASSGDKAQVKIKEWLDPSKSPKGELVRIIGRAGEHNTEMLGIVYESGFEVDFPVEVEKEADEYMYPQVHTFFEASAWKILGKNHTLIDAISFCSEHFVSENDDLTSKTF